MAKRKVTSHSVRESGLRANSGAAGQNRVIMIAAAILIVAVLALALARALPDRAAQEGQTMTGDRPLAELAPAERADAFGAPPQMIIDTARNYEAIIHTGKGQLRLRLFDDASPVTVNNFVFLANQGFYDGTLFHRVIEEFMAQGGDPTGTGMGGPGYQFADETDNGLVFDRAGLLAMANAGPDTNGSQFFITFQPTPHLDGLHTIFGELIAGEAILDQINRVQPGDGGTADVIERIDIVESEG
jgi:cyclophilin family peptidyl-prolyl cis-trans isomerase